jgi:uncharacterized protein YprB with RNaseH-like and TPR domain
MGDDRQKDDEKRKELRARLESLNRGPLKGKVQIGISPDETTDKAERKREPAADTTRQSGTAKRPSPKPIVYRRDVPREERPSRPRPTESATVGGSVKLEDAVDGVEVTYDGRRYFYVSSRVERLDGLAAVEDAFRKAVTDTASGLRPRVEASCGLETLSLEDMIFMDVECTGLGVTPLFLIGTMTWTDGGLEVRQFFARDYSEEAPVISSFAEACVGKTLLVTFNGKSFDMPLVRARSAANGLAAGPEPAHFDLLHESRRVWRNALPNCKLQTLEARICGRPRYGDIPGREIPDAYHAYVHSGNAVQMVDVLHHNMLDLVTLADLSARLPGQASEPIGQ